MSIDPELKFINLPKTIEVFGSPINTYSRVIYTCICGKDTSCKIGDIRQKIKRNSIKNGVALCNSCSQKEVYANESVRQRHMSACLSRNSSPDYIQSHLIGCIRHSKTRIQPISKDVISYISVDETVSLFGQVEKTSSKVISCCTDGCNRKLQTTVNDIKRAIKKHGNYLCNSCRLKTFYSVDSNLDKLISNALRLWEDDNYREKQTRSQSSRWTDELKSMTSLFLLDLWKDDNYRLKQGDGLRKIWTTTKFRETMKLVRGRLRDHNSLTMKKKWADPTFREKQLKIIYNTFLDRKDSSLERTAQSILTSVNIEFIRHFNVGEYEFDLYVPSHNILIECQGEYWHSTDKNKGRDASKFTYVNEYFPQYKVLYLYERDFLNPNTIKQKIESCINGGIAESQIDFNFHSVSIRELFVKEKLTKSYYSAPEEFLQAFHYAGYGRSAKKLYGAFLDEKLIAVCKFAGIIRKEVSTSMGLLPSAVLELDRFCIHPQYQKKNFASWMLSRCSTIIFNEFPKVTTLVSFADSTYGHSGTIYKASNWTELHKVKPSYYYVNSERHIIHKKTLWDKASKLKKGEAEYAQEHGYMKVYGKEKTKFVLYRK